MREAGAAGVLLHPRSRLTLPTAPGHPPPAPRQNRKGWARGGRQTRHGPCCEPRPLPPKGQPPGTEQVRVGELTAAFVASQIRSMTECARAHGGVLHAFLLPWFDEEAKVKAKGLTECGATTWPENVESLAGPYGSTYSACGRRTTFHRRPPRGCCSPEG